MLCRRMERRLFPCWLARRIAARGAFTLVELLVVMAVICILAALLFPSLLTVKFKVRTLQCLSNFKQIGAAQYLYAGDWGGVLTPVQAYGAYWERRMDPYLKPRKASWLPNSCMICPEAPNTYKGGYKFDDLLRTYEATQCMLYKLKNQHYNYGDFTRPMPLTNFLKPSASLLIYDGRQQGTNVYCLVWCIANKLPPNTEWQSFIDFRHSGKIAGVYVDGHVGTLHLSDINRNMWSDYWN